LDQRSYSFEEMTRAAKKVRMDRVLTEDVIEQFEALIERTQKISIRTQEVIAPVGEVNKEKE